MLKKMPHGRKYDWAALKKEYLSGDVTSVQEFLTKKGLRTKTTVYQQSRGWAREKDELKQKMVESASRSLIETSGDDIRKLRKRQANLARFLQMKGAKKLESVTNEELSAEDARRMIVAGMIQERKAVGIESSGDKPSVGSMTQINIDQGSTNFDKLLQTLDYEGILKLIAELKHLRAGDIVPEASTDGTTETEDGEVI